MPSKSFLLELEVSYLHIHQSISSVCEVHYNIFWLTLSSNQQILEPKNTNYAVALGSHSPTVPNALVILTNILGFQALQIHFIHLLEAHIPLAFEPLCASSSWKT